MKIINDEKCYNIAYGLSRGTFSEQHKMNISKNHYLNNGGVVSAAARIKNSIAQKKRIGKSGTTNGRSFYNDGITEKLLFLDDAPPGWNKGRLKDSLRGLSIGNPNHKKI